MNIIYMHTHDSGRYISPYGYQIPTPALMKFAKEATLFGTATAQDRPVLQAGQGF